MKQTAVEFLIDMISYTSRDTYSAMVNSGFLEQAKQMEKEQHEDTWLDSRIEDKGDNYIGNEKSFEQYYNENYGGKHD